MVARNCKSPSKQAREFVYKRLYNFMVRNKKQIDQDHTTAQEIAKRFGVPSSTVHKIARELNIKIAVYENLSLADDPRFKFGSERLHSWGAHGLVLPVGVKARDFTKNGKATK